MKQVIILDASLDAKWRRAMQSPELLGPLLQVERNILGASPSMQGRILSVATRCATEPCSAAPPRRGTGPPPSSDAEASTDRAPRPAVWASTALSSGRVAVRGAGATGGKRGAAGRAGASRGRQPLPTTPPTRTSLALSAPRTDTCNASRASLRRAVKGSRDREHRTTSPLIAFYRQISRGIAVAIL